MGMTLSEIKQLKLGNTIKAVTDLSKIDSSYIKATDRYAVRIGKYVRASEGFIYLLGYKEGEYKLGEMPIRISDTVFTRSRLTGKASEVVNTYFNEYIKYLKGKEKIEETMRKEKLRADKLRENIKKHEAEAEAKVREIHSGNIAAGDKVFKLLEEMYPEYDAKIVFDRGDNLGYYIGLSRQSKAGAFTITNYSHGASGIDLKYLYLDVRYDYSTVVEGEDEDYERELRHQWYLRVPKLTANNIDNLGGVRTTFDVTSSGHKIGFEVTYHFNISATDIDDKTVEKLAKFIADKCFVKQ